MFVKFANSYKYYIDKSSYWYNIIVNCKGGTREINNHSARLPSLWYRIIISCRGGNYITNKYSTVLSDNTKTILATYRQEPNIRYELTANNLSID